MSAHILNNHQSQVDSIPHLDSLDFVMESLACGHTVMDNVAAHEALQVVADSVTLADINALCRSMLTFASDYGNEAAVSRTISIVLLFFW